jgi:hypothetical protein
VKSSHASLGVLALAMSSAVVACGGCSNEESHTGGISVTVTPGQAEVAVGGRLTFQASVEGASDPSVVWSVREAGGGQIDASGGYAAPAAPGTFTVVAASVAKSTATGTARVLVRQPGSTDLSAIVPADRLTTWDPGLEPVGGIPARTTVFRTLAPSGADDTAAIQAALDACPADQVVQLEPGVFTISGDGLAIAHAGITLRGSGPDRTRLVKPEGSGNSTIAIGQRWFGYTQSTDLAADAMRGSQSVTLARELAVQPGEIVVIDQLTDARWTMWNPTNQPPGHDSRAWFARRDRPVGQVLEVESVSGPKVRFTTPLHLDFLVGDSAQLSRRSTEDGGEPVPAVQRVGIEDLTLDGGEGHDGGGNAHFWAAAYSWVKNVESRNTLGASVSFSGTFRCELRDSYVHDTRDPNPGGNGYGVSLDRYAADNLVENNIIWNFNKVMVMRATGGGNVFGYNYLEDGWGAAYPNIPEVGLNASHMTTPHHELFEGNQAWNFGGDSYWGNSIYITVFRNHLTGKRRSLPPLQLTDADQRRFVDVPEWHWWYSFVGNVLGTPGMSPSPQTGFVQEASPPWSYDPVPLWVIGPQVDSGRGGQDPDVAARTLRHGNYDYVDHAVRWDPAIARHDLPDSLYRKTKPAFFGARPWPWVTPEDATTQLHELPARARMDAMR